MYCSMKMLRRLFVLTVCVSVACSLSLVLYKSLMQVIGLEYDTLGAAVATDNNASRLEYDDLDTGEETLASVDNDAVEYDAAVSFDDWVQQQQQQQDESNDVTRVRTVINDQLARYLARNKTSVEFVVQQKLSHIRLPIRVRRGRGQWQRTASRRHEIYVMSAYYDDRPLVTLPQVRVIAVAETSSTQSVCCLLWYDALSTPRVSEASVIQIGAPIVLRNDRVYDQVIFSCPALTAPTNVSLVTSFSVQPTTLLPVQLPLKPLSASDIVDFGHCMSIMYWKQDPYRLVEWLELHRIFGVAEINIYVHDVDNLTDSILRRYADTGFVHYTVSPAPFHSHQTDENAILVSMSPVINDCMYRNMYRYRYVVCTDIDEVIVPAKHRTYRRLLESIRPDDATKPRHSFLFRNAYFFLDFGASSSEPWFLVTQRYRRRVRPSKYGYSAKSITRPLSCVGLQNHLCWSRLPAFEHDSNWNIEVRPGCAMNHHYKRCHFDNYLGRNGVCLRMMTRSMVDDRTMLQFATQLANAVARQLLKLDIVEMTNGTTDWKKQFRIP